jgi:RNase P subunit RPR2
MTGEHWWDGDRQRHVEDLPRYCPHCAAAIDPESGLAVEYWEADRRVYHTWCKSCGWSGDITRVDRVVGHEVAE